MEPARASVATFCTAAFAEVLRCVVLSACWRAVTCVRSVVAVASTAAWWAAARAVEEPSRLRETLRSRAESCVEMEPGLG